MEALICYNRKMKKKILDAFYAYEETQSTNNSSALITIPMTIICNLLHAQGKPIYEAFGLTQAQTDMLVVLHIYNDGLTASEVSERMVFSSGGISKVVKKLESKKLIYKKESPQDKRSSLLYLEEEGKRIAQTCMPLFGENDKYFYDVLNKTEKETLEKAFKKILYSIAEKKE